MSIFPQVNVPVDTIIQATQNTNLPLLKEYAWDYKNNDFLLESGKFVIVEGLEAIKVWIWKALQTQRYRYLAYTWQYGNEIENVIGQGLSNSATQAEIKRYVEECLSINPYIQGITSFNLILDDSKVGLDLTVLTVYGEVTLSV